ncbi:MAG: glycosyltransferase family 9 protein [Bryobacteraceae bacterium]|jgi:ADP-heptose:LPS heptosyltransferase
MKVLVYQIGSLGDTIVLIPSLRAIRKHFGRGAHLAVLHNVDRAGVVTTKEVLQCTPLADEFIPYQFEEPVARRLRTACSLWRQLRARRFDAVVSLLPSERPPAALRRDAWFFRTCGIPRVIGFETVPDSVVRPRQDGRAMPVQNEALILLQRLRDSGIPAEANGHLRIPLLQPGRGDRAAAAAWLAASRHHPQRALIALCPGCKKPANSWPLERFIELGRRILSTGSAEIVILGGPTDRAAAQRLMTALSGEALNAAGEFSVSGSAALLSQCQFLVGLDTGTTHLAAAVGVPCVVIQSANSHAGHWDPLGESHTVLRQSVPCAGCLCTECPVAGHPCMTGISVDDVWQIVGQALLPAAAFQAAHRARA